MGLAIRAPPFPRAHRAAFLHSPLKKRGPISIGSRVSLSGVFRATGAEAWDSACHGFQTIFSKLCRRMRDTEAALFIGTYPIF
jgi:hypothetical protein